MTALTTYIRNAHGSAVFISHPVLPVMISLILLPAKALVYFLERKYGQGCQGCAVLSGFRLTGFRFSQSDLGGNTTIGGPVGLFGFWVFVLVFVFVCLFTINHDLLDRH